MFSFDTLSDSPIIMGILNVTPDSFSDGGLYCDVDKAYEKVSRDFDDGADIIDIGGESSRPGAENVSASREMTRVIPIIKKIKTKLPDMTLSIDTTKPEIAYAALNEGVDIVNDINGGRDPKLLEIVGLFNAGLVLMHMQGNPRTMQLSPSYANVTYELINFLESRIAEAEHLGVTMRQICVDPGIGFGKTLGQNYEILANVEKFVRSFDCVMLGASRKRFLRDTVKENDPLDVIGATCTTTTYGVFQGVKIFRVHDVKENRHAADVASVIKKYRL